jgi:hypothetical protein
MRRLVPLAAIKVKAIRPDAHHGWHAFSLLNGMGAVKTLSVFTRGGYYSMSEQYD